ncbi:hypothetical protein MTO96_036784 [Rhipicephalus appendiculatus]
MHAACREEYVHALPEGPNTPPPTNNERCLYRWAMPMSMPAERRLRAHSHIYGRRARSHPEVAPTLAYAALPENRRRPSNKRGRTPPDRSRQRAPAK